MKLKAKGYAPVPSICIGEMYEESYTTECSLTERYAALDEKISKKLRLRKEERSSKKGKTKEGEWMKGEGLVVKCER